MFTGTIARTRLHNRLGRTRNYKLPCDRIGFTDYAQVTTLAGSEMNPAGCAWEARLMNSSKIAEAAADSKTNPLSASMAP